MTKPFKFEARQRDNLARWITARQIDALETHALPVVRFWLTKPLPVAGARKLILDVERPLQAACAALQEIENGSSPKHQDAALAFYIARAESQLNLSPVLLSLVNACRLANEVLPIQARLRSASPLPIAAIWNALVNAQDLKRTGKSGSPPMSFRPSRSQTGAFRDIVCTCYEAVTGKKDADPDRAIRAYLQLRERERKQFAKRRKEVKVTLRDGS